MSKNFKNINYLNMLLETVRYYFTYNAQGQISILYKFCSSFTVVLQSLWGTMTDTILTTFSGWRNNKLIIANCKWQIGQLTNVLNSLFTSNILLDNTEMLTVGNTYIVREGWITYNSVIFYSPCDAFVCVSRHTFFTGTGKIQDTGIYISQSSLLQTFVPDHNGNPSTVTFYVPDHNGTPSANAFVNPFNQTLTNSNVIIHVPNSLFTDSVQMNSLISSIEQIKITGLNYTIISI
jgi:hypothetical protein